MLGEILGGHISMMKEKENVLVSSQDSNFCSSV